MEMVELGEEVGVVSLNFADGILLVWMMRQAVEQDGGQVSSHLDRTEPRKVNRKDKQIALFAKRRGW